jgi:hypothetical protein
MVSPKWLSRIWRVLLVGGRHPVIVTEVVQAGGVKAAGRAGLRPGGAA